MADNLLNQTLATAREFTRPLRETLFPSPNKKTIEQRLKEAIAKGDKEEVKRLNAEAGTLSAFTGVYTGLPDLGVLGYNWATSSNIKDLRTKVLEAAGVPTKASDTDNELAYNLPDYAAMAVGVTQLLKGAKAGISKWRDSKRMKEFLADLETSSGKDTANFFEKFMVTGQGSDNPMVHAALAQMKNNPKYAEMFTTLDKAATDAALKGFIPKQGALTQKDRAAKELASGVQGKLEALRSARAEAGAENFTKAYAIAGERGLVNPEATLSNIRKLRDQYAAGGTPQSESVVTALDKLENVFAPTITSSQTKGTSVVRAGTPDVTIPGSSGYSFTRPGEPTRVIPGSQGYTTYERVAETTYDAAGMPRTTYTNRPITVPATAQTTVRGTPEQLINIPSTQKTVLKGTPDVTMNIPGSAGYTVRQSPQLMNVPKVQRLLSEFGAKAATEDSLVQGLSKTDIDRINVAVFSGLKDDLVSSIKSAPDSEARQALLALDHAREQTRIRSDAYNKLIANGIPKFLQDKSIDEIDMTTLSSAYEGLNKGQRTLFRAWVGESKAEALKALDGKVFSEFLSKSHGTLPDGTEGYDLGKLARAWNELKVKDPNQADMLVQSLGTNAGEFNKRMQDALVFTRKMSVGGLPGEEASKADRVAKDIGRAAGIASYAAKQGVDLAYDVSSTVFKQKGLTDDLIARALLTPEGANFLKQAALSPTSKKALEALSEVQNAQVAHPLYTAMGTLTAPATRPANASQGDVYIPDDVFIPEDLLPKAGTAPSGVQPQSGEITNDVYIPDDVLGSVSYATEPAMKQAAQGTVDEGLTQDQIMQGVIRDNPGVALDELTRRLQAGVNYKP